MNDKGKIKIATLCGSIRERSFNRFLMSSLPSLAPGSMLLDECALIQNVPHYDGDLQERSGLPVAIVAMANKIKEASGLIIVSPEYNYSIPGALKNAIDWLSRANPQPLARKPVLIQSVSTGILGGARMQYHLRQVLVALDAYVMPRPEIMVGIAPTKFSEAGMLTDIASREAIEKQLNAFRDFIVQCDGSDRGRL